jgi:hypothetical protein
MDIAEGEELQLSDHLVGSRPGALGLRLPELRDGGCNVRF